MLIVVALLATVCACVGWQAKIVRERKALALKFVLSVENSDRKPAWIREWFGDALYDVVWLNSDATDDEIDYCAESSRKRESLG